MLKFDLIPMHQLKREVYISYQQQMLHAIIISVSPIGRSPHPVRVNIVLKHPYHPSLQVSQFETNFELNLGRFHSISLGYYHLIVKILRAYTRTHGNVLLFPAASFHGFSFEQRGKK